MQKFFIVHWHDKDAKYFDDLIPSSAISSIANVSDQSHELVNKSTSEVLHASFDVERTDDGLILLRYGGRHAAANKCEGVYTGDVRLDPENFVGAPSLEWRDEGEDEFEKIEVTVIAGYIEGELSTREITSRKRSRAVNALVKALGQARGKCDACGYTPHPGYGKAKYACFEVHHIKPLANGARLSPVEDFAWICANCHRAITALGNPKLETFIEQLRKASPERAGAATATDA